MNYKLFQDMSLSMLGTRNMRLMVFSWVSVLSSYLFPYICICSETVLAQEKIVLE